MKQVQLQKSVTDAKGTIYAGAIYNWSDEEQCYVLRDNDGFIISTVNDEFVKQVPEMFKYVVDEKLN